MAKPIYLFDASVFINLVHQYPSDVAFFSNIWKKIDHLVADGRLTSHREVSKEVKDASFDPWRQRHAKIFKIEESHFATLREVLEKFPQLNDDDKEDAHADPFLVAMALEHLRKKEQLGASYQQMVIVTDEAKQRMSPKKIPYVAKQFGIDCIGLMEFFKWEDWEVKAR